MLIKKEYNRGGEPSFIFYANIVIILQITKSAIILYAAQWRFGKDRKYHMRPLDNIISLEQFTQMREGNRISFARSPWWTDCINQVELWICQDRTTTKDNLREKAESYARNYLCTIPELPSIDKDGVVKEIADQVESDLEDATFDQRPPASVVAQKERDKIPEDPERKFIRLCP